MDVTERIVLSATRSLEFGAATWDATKLSVRNRYDNEDGRFSPRGSSELPIPDLTEIIVATARRDLIATEAAERMIGALVASLARLGLRDGQD